jgi:hypothetical protein
MPLNTQVRFLIHSRLLKVAGRVKIIGGRIATRSRSIPNLSAETEDWGFLAGGFGLYSAGAVFLERTWTSGMAVRNQAVEAVVGAKGEKVEIDEPLAHQGEGVKVLKCFSFGAAFEQDHGTVFGESEPDLADHPGFLESPGARCFFTQHVAIALCIERG